MTPEFISSIAGILLSLVASYAPKFSGWYEAQEPTYKRVVMLVALAGATIGVVGVSCSHLYPIIECNKSGIMLLIRCFGLAVVANQSTFLLSPHK